MQRRRAKRNLASWTAALALTLAACQGGDEAPPPGAAGETADTGGAAAPSDPAVPARGDAARGREIYGNICSTCHGSSPTEAGTVGPAIAGSPPELVEAKVLRGEYPPGYTPKRGSRAMPPMPFLEDHLPDIVAYLQAAQDG